MPFQIFRRYQRTMLAALAIMAMFAFVLADSLPRLFNTANTSGVDRVVAELDGREVHRSDLERLRLQRVRANYVLSQLAMRIGGQPVVPYFDGQTLGQTDDQAMIDALILEAQAAALGMPSTPELAREWIFEQAKQRHEQFRQMAPTLTPFDPTDLAAQLEGVFARAFGREMTVAAFLTDVANQVRILETLELLAQPIVTPLDTFQVYGNRALEVEAKYAEFAVADYLDRVGEPKADDLRAFFEANAGRLPDPESGSIGFRVPGRSKVEYVALGVEALDRLREQIASRPLADTIRGANGFEEDVADAYQAVLNERERGSPVGPIPLNPFAETGDEGEIVLSYPAEFANDYVEQQVQERIDEEMLTAVEDIFDPVREAMNDFTDTAIDGDFDAIRTGLEPEVDREALPRLGRVLREGKAGKELVTLLGPGGSGDEGISAVQIGLTRLLADRGTFGELLTPEGIPPSWRDYLAIARLDWADAPEPLLRNVQRLTRASEGLERPDPLAPSPTESFAEALFGEDAPLFEPREFTDELGRRFLAWKTMSFPETSRSFRDTPEDLVASLWRQDRARELAREAAERLADRVRKADDPDDSTPSATLDRIAAEEGLMTRSTGPRRRVDDPSRLAPIAAGEEIQEALFGLSPSGSDAAAVAPDRDRDHYYTFAFGGRRDGGVPGAAMSADDSQLDFTGALTSLQFDRVEADAEAANRRASAVLEYLRNRAGLPPDWTPPEPGQG